MTLEQEIVNAVLQNLTGRCGLRQAWDEIDDEIQGEIRDELECDVLKLLQEKENAKLKASGR